MCGNALYSYLSHEIEKAMFCLEINAYFAAKFRYENPFASAQNLRRAVLCCVDIRLRDFWEI